MTGVIVPFVGVTYRDAVIGKCPQLFDQSIVQLFVPFSGEECCGFRPVYCEVDSISPLGISGVSQ